MLALLAACAACTVVPRQTLPTDPAMRGRGGTVQFLSTGRMRSLDPQRLAPGPESSFATNTYLRTLTTRRPAPAGALGELVPDLALALGESSDGGRSWVFPLREDVPWQDGSQLTCADFAYGIARAYGPRADSPGSRLVRALVDVPLLTGGARAGQPVYGGPGSPAGAGDFARAVSCDGPHLRIALRRPIADFNEIVTIPAFAPYKQEYDRGVDGDFIVFTCGAYMLEGKWHDDGGRFVRSRNFRVDTDPVRRVKANAVELVEGLSPAEVSRRLTAVIATPASSEVVDFDRHAAVQLEGLADPVVRALPAAGANPVLDEVRWVEITGAVDALVMTATSGPLSRGPVRRAFAVATDRAAYVATSSGTLRPSAALAPTWPMVSLDTEPNVAGPKAEPTRVGPVGTPADANAALVAAGVTTPVAVRLAYPQGLESGVAALMASWRAAGFQVTAQPLGQTRQGEVASVPEVDVVLTTATPLWPSAAAVVGGLLDTTLAAYAVATPVRLRGPAVLQEAIAAAFAEPDSRTSDREWRAVEDEATRSGTVVPLAQHVATRVHDPVIRGYLSDAFSVPSLAEMQLLPDETAAP